MVKRQNKCNVRVNNAIKKSPERSNSIGVFQILSYHVIIITQQIYKNFLNNNAMAESTLQKIARKTGRKVSFCKCNECKKQCTTPCLGTPEDIEKIIDAGHGNRIFLTEWWAGVIMGATTHPILMYQAELVEETGFCTFFKDGLCTIHDAGLKPTEGKLSHHSTRIDNFKASKSISWQIAKEWIDPKNNATIQRIKEKLNV